jgi:hypothetical protein
MTDSEPIGSMGGEAAGSSDDELAGRAQTHRAFISVVRDPIMIAIFLLAGIFDVLSGDPIVHGAVLFAIAGVLTFDATAGRHDEPSARRAPIRPALTPILVLIAVVYVVFIGSFARYSWPSSLAVVVLGGAGVALAWRRPIGPDPDPTPLDPAGAITWVCVFVALALWELSALLLQPSLTTSSQAHPTISTLMDPVLATHVGRSITLLLWLAFGWFLLDP